jgi:nickel-type superoxide dismutase maturation protease
VRLRLPFRLVPIAVTGTSMAPTIHPGDLCLVRWGASIRPGDVVVARLPDRPLGVKRAIEFTPDGWVLAGDNPAASTDSRTFGAVPATDVLGRVLVRYWPLSTRPLVGRRVARKSWQAG